MAALKKGDEIRVIAPSYHMSQKRHEQTAKRALERLENLGYKITFGEHLTSQYHLGTARVSERIEDFHAAFADAKVKAVMAFTGGWSANELLPFIDWQLLKKNPKPLIGFSDITVLLNALYAKTGLAGYLGPTFNTLGEMTSWEYTLTYLDAVLQQTAPLSLYKSEAWSEKPNQIYKTHPWRVLQRGEAEAILLGGNLGTFYLLQGTQFQPDFASPFILAIEDDDESGKNTAREFARRLESLLQLPNVRKNIRGILIGRFQPNSKVKKSDVKIIIASKKISDIPIVADVDFGHTIPLLTLPIGGTIKLKAEKKKVALSIINYG